MKLNSPPVHLYSPLAQQSTYRPSGHDDWQDCLPVTPMSTEVHQIDSLIRKSSCKSSWFCFMHCASIVKKAMSYFLLNFQIFSQTHVTKARSELVQTFAKSGALMTSSVFRDCFPLLRGRNIVYATGFEVINTRVDGLTRPAAASFRHRTRSCNPTLFEGDGASALTALTLKCWKEDIVSAIRRGCGGRRTPRNPCLWERKGRFRKSA